MYSTFFSYNMPYGLFNMKTLSHNLNIIHFPLTDFHNRLQQWYARHGRKDLPWRNLARDGSQSYEIYISEIMLQQTQVMRVLRDFYFPFLQRFPNLYVIANATQQEILMMWQGLGYYTRARNLHATAQICVQQYGGKLPKDKENLRKLPGIGAYSAGAIACFGFGESVSFVDSNIKRVFSRLFALSNPTKAQLENLAARLLDRHKSFEYNQALLDIGAMLCVVKPHCSLCPLISFCKGRFSPQQYPIKIQKHREILYLNIFIITFSKSKQHFIVLQAPTQEMPAYTCDSKQTNKKRQSNLYAGLYNLPILYTNPVARPHAIYSIGSFKHAYTKYTITAEVIYKQCEDKHEAMVILESMDYQFAFNYPKSTDSPTIQSIHADTTIIKQMHKPNSKQHYATNSTIESTLDSSLQSHNAIQSQNTHIQTLTNINNFHDSIDSPQKCNITASKQSKKYIVVKLQNLASLPLSNLSHKALKLAATQFQIFKQ